MKKYTVIKKDFYICNDCGSYASLKEKVIHHKGCKDGYYEDYKDCKNEESKK